MTREMDRWHRHFGIYGVCLNTNGNLLVVKKNGGPYDGLWDLPGGSLENPESIAQCLEREMLEETGMGIKIEHHFGCFDVLTDAPYHGYRYTHHIAVLFLVSVSGQKTGHIETFVNDKGGPEENDSLGFAWVAPELMHERNASPLVLQTLRLLKQDESFNLVEYKIRKHPQ